MGFGNLTSGSIGFGKGARTNGGVVVNFQNVDLVRKILGEVEGELKSTANREMRKGAVEIAKDTLIPALKMSAYSSGVPIAPAMADTMRARSDRVVTVAVGAVNPRLSGFKRGIGVKRANGRTTQTGRDASSRSWRTTLAWGSELGPFNPDVNHYAVSRSSGHWVKPGINAPGTLNAVKAAYSRLIESIITKYSRYR